MNLLARRHSNRRRRKRPIGVKARPMPPKPCQNEPLPAISSAVEDAVRCFAQDPELPSVLKLPAEPLAAARRQVHRLAAALGLSSRSCGLGRARRVVLRKGGNFRCPDCSLTFWAWSACLAHCRATRHGGGDKRLQQRCAVARSRRPQAVRVSRPAPSRFAQHGSGQSRPGGWPPMPGDSPTDDLPQLPPAPPGRGIGKRWRRRRSAGSQEAEAALRVEARACRSARREAGRRAATAERDAAASAAIANANAAAPLDASNRGHWLLTNLGWSPGVGLGAAEKGAVELVSATVAAQSSRRGLGMDG